MEKQQRSRMLGEMPLHRLVPRISVPIMISMLVQALYNVVDSIFVARFDPAALTAVSLVYPIQMLMIALSTGLGVGINSLVSRKLGEGDGKAARIASANGVMLEFMGSMLFVVIGLFLSPTFMRMFTSDAQLQGMGATYLTIVCAGSVGLFMSITVERLLQATGNTFHSMVVQLTGAVINIVLDPILIFGYLGLPAMGIAGAAWATVIGQWCSMVLGFWLNHHHNAELRLHRSSFRLQRSMVQGVLAVGLPSTVMSSIGSVLTVMMNLLLIGYGDAAVSVLGVYFKLQSFVFMPVFGLSNGLVAIIAYNYGARSRSRVHGAIRVALWYAMSIMVAGTLLFLLAPGTLMGLFEANGASELTLLGIPALRIISIHFPLAALGITLSTTFQAVGRGSYSLLMSICRQLAVLLPAAWVLSLLGGLNAIWWCFPIAEVVSLALCLYLYRKCDRELLQKMDTV